MRIGVVLAIGLLASVARADVSQDKLTLKLTAEQLEKDAHATKADDKYVQCGGAYTDLFNFDPKAAGAEGWLYNAGVCFQEGRSFGAAIPMYERLDKDFPSSRLRSKAIARLANLYDRLAMFPQAAVLLERYAKQYAGEKDAKDALSEAVAIRKAYGDDAKTIEDTRYFLKLYGAKDPKTAAEAMYGMTEVYRRKSAAELEAHLREFLRQFPRAERDLRVRATLELAESVWKRSCAVPGSDGLCLKFERGRVLPIAQKPPKATPMSTRCGPPTSLTLAVLPRDNKLVDEATKLLHQTVKLVEQSPAATTQYFHARAKLLLADQTLEAYAAVRFPTGLDFSPERTRAKEASLKKFNDFVQTRTKLGADAQREYTAILSLKDASTAIAATQRLGFLPHSFATELEHGEIPKDVRTGEFAKEKVEAFCDKLLETAEPLFKQAITGYDVCLAKSSQLGIRDASTRACARERAALGPTTSPLTTERLPEAPLALPVFDEEPVRRSASLPVPFREAVEQFWAVYGPTPIPNDKCLPLAVKFEGIAKQTKSADAWFMAGLTYGRCQREATAKAKAAYEAALVIDPKHGTSISNLGEIAMRAGNLDVAKARWTAALLIDEKLFAAHLGLATLALRDYRTATAPNRGKLAQKIELHAKTAAGLARGDNALPYVQLGILAMLDGKPAVAKYLADRADKLDTAPHTQLLYAALSETEGVSRLERASTATWQVPEIRLALALHQLALGRYDEATKSLAQATPSYEVLIARGVAARGLGKLADAEARYLEASKLDPARAEAHFNLGVLFKDHVAARATDPAAAKTAFKKAADAFRRANTPEAKLWADDCDRAATLL